MAAHSVSELFDHDVPENNCFVTPVLTDATRTTIAHLDRRAVPAQLAEIFAQYQFTGNMGSLRRKSC